MCSRGSTTVAAIVVAIAVACGSKASEPPPAPIVVDAPAAVVVDVASAIVVDASVAGDEPEAVWQRYRDAHAGATTANAIATGTTLWAMLSPEAQRVVEQAATTTIAAATRTTGQTFDLAEMRVKLLGESAASRVAFMKHAAIVERIPHPDETRGGTVTSSVTLIVKSGTEKLTFELTKSNGSWRFAPSPALVASEDAVFKTPAGQESNVGSPTAEAAIARWKQVNAGGTGWDAYNALSPDMRRKILRMVASVGGNGAPDAARIFEKTLTDRRTRGMTITGTRVIDQAAEHARFEISYSNGKPEEATAVKVDGVWWIELAL